MVLGDSISAGYGMNIDQGWVALMDKRLIEQEINWTMKNASISGETTGGALARLPSLIQEINPHIVIIELGGNDGLRGYPIQKMRSNIEDMVDMVLKTAGTPILMEMRIPPNYGRRYTTAFEQAYVDIAKAKEIAVIPFSFEEFVLEEGLMQEDGIHPSAKAQPKLLEVIWKFLQPHLI